MNPLTRQDFINALNHMRDNILSQTANKQDIINAVTTISQKSSAPNEVAHVFDINRDKLMERLNQPLKQQWLATQQILQSLDVMSHKLEELGAAIRTISENLHSVHSDTQTVAHRTEPQKRTMMSQIFNG